MPLEKQMDPRPLRFLQAAVLALAAAVLQQIVHESTHGFVALAVGKHWDMLNLFASGTSWPGEPIPSGDGWVAGSAAIVDIIAGGVGLLLLNHATLIARPRWRQALFYYAAISWIAGFGYLFIDAIFFSPGGSNIGDWRKVIALFGGSWSVRLPILAIGLAGTLATYVWMPKDGAAIRDRRARSGTAPLCGPPHAPDSLFECECGDDDAVLRTSPGGNRHGDRGHEDVDGEFAFLLVLFHRRLLGRLPGRHRSNKPSARDGFHRVDSAARRFRRRRRRHIAADGQLLAIATA